MREESGAVVVLVALWMPLIAILMTFAIDVGHWFDYKRSLQARADAAALAAGSAYGTICFASGGPSAASLHGLGYVAQGYTGADTTTSDLPYLPYSVAVPTGSSSYYNIPNLAKGKLSDYHVLFNSKDYWNLGGHDFNMAADSSNSDTAYCNSNADNYDVDKSRHGAMFDVKLTQANLGLFFALPFTSVPAINAHSRVELQPQTTANRIRPIAIRDANSIPCVSVEFHRTDNNALIGTPVVLQREPVDPLNPTGPSVWDNGSGTDVSIPSGSNVYVRPFLNNCASPPQGDYYDSNSGILYVNGYDGSASTPPAAGSGPKIMAGVAGDPNQPGGVSLVTGGCSPDQYFTTGHTTSATDCTVNVVATIGFANDSGKLTVTNLDTGDSFAMSKVTGNTWISSSFTIDLQSGQNRFSIDWEQTSGTIGLKTCSNAHNNPCTGTFGVQQEAFSACDGCADPDDSGPIIQARLAEGATVLTNNLTSGTHHLTVQIEIAGLQNSKPGDKPIVLRYNTSTSQSTGLIDCGQGNGASADAAALSSGCPLIGTPDCKVSDYCAPFAINTRSGVCTPSLRLSDPTADADCVATTQGTRASQIPGAIASRIVVGGKCSANNWGGTVPPGDPRAITMIVTSPADLQGTGGQIIPIRKFATFYVTGWDTSGSIPNCNPAGTNEAYPGSTRKNAQKGAIWGHWIEYVDPGGGGGSGQFCDPTLFGNCVAVLTR
jgi:hypothetical protein